MSTLPFQLLVATLAGWVNRNQQDVIEYLQEENRVLREHLGGRRLLFTDALAANGIQPASIRRMGMSWETFLKSHWGVIAATNFFNVEVFTSAGLIRYFVLFVIDLKTRRIKIAGIIPQPDARPHRMSREAGRPPDVLLSAGGVMPLEFWHSTARAC